MIKRIKYICYILLVSMVFTGCSKNEDSNYNIDTTDDTAISEQSTEQTADSISSSTEEEVISEYYALGKTYYGNKGFDGFNSNDEIVNSSNYVQGEYKEVDFAIDLVTNHLLADKSIYASLISTDENGSIIPLTEEDQLKVESEMYSFKVEQYGVSEDTPLYFNFISAQFFGTDGDGVKIYVRGHVSGYAISYIVTVYEQGNNLVAKIK